MVSSMSSTANMTRCRPSVLGGGLCGSAPTATGVWYSVSSSLLWPSGVRIIAMSLRTPSSPTVRSAQRPSICALPSSSMPSSVKNATAASRSSTTMPTLSIRWMVIGGGLLLRQATTVLAIVSPGLPIVGPGSDGTTSCTEHPQDQPDHDEDDPDRPQDRDGEYEPKDQTDE